MDSSKEILQKTAVCGFGAAFKGCFFKSEGRKAFFVKTSVTRTFDTYENKREKNQYRPRHRKAAGQRGK